MEYDVIAERDFNSEHKKSTTFGITFLSIQKWLNQRQNTR